MSSFLPLVIRYSGDLAGIVAILVSWSGCECGSGKVGGGGYSGGGGGSSSGRGGSGIAIIFCACGDGIAAVVGTVAYSVVVGITFSDS